MSDLTVHPEGIHPKIHTKSSPNLQTPWQKQIFRYIDGTRYQLMSMALLMLSLFLAVSFTCGNVPDSENDALYALLIVIFSIFLCEVIILCVVQDKYLFSFFFWMDCLGTLSILLDVGWITKSFISHNGSDGSSARVLRATRAAKLGARYGRLMRLLKILRFFKYVPCLSKKEEQQEPTMSAVRRVSNELSLLLAQRVAGLVMLLVIVIPFLQFQQTDYSFNAWINSLKSLAKNETTTAYDINYAAAQFQQFYRYKTAKLISLHVDSPHLPDSPFKFDYFVRSVIRADNMVTFIKPFKVSGGPTAAKPFQVKAIVDFTVENQQDSMFSILVIVLVIIVLIGFSTSFQRAVDQLIVVPLDHMMKTLRSSAVVMLKSMKAISAADEEKNRDRFNEGGIDDADSDLDGELETALLEKMVEKLSNLASHIIPTEVVVSDTIDKGTANWLNESFGQTHDAKLHNLEVVDEYTERARLHNISSRQSLVSRSELNSWDFDVLRYTNEQLNEIFLYLFDICNFFESFQVPVEVFKEFLGEISLRYLGSNSYHNFQHGCDVCHTTYRLISASRLNVAFSQLELYSIMVAALAHDVGHPGLNNAFLVKSKHELALRHNDKSPLENMHCAVLYDILSKQSCNVFVGLTENDWRESRKIVITSILGTDMTHHFEQISKAQVFLDVHGEDTQSFCRGESGIMECFSDEKNRLLLLELILHSADVSNPFKDFDVCARWADLVVEEFVQQGDKERLAHFEVSPMMDRDTIVLCNMQMGFVEFVVSPLITTLIKIFPLLFDIGLTMTRNFRCWGERRKTELRASLIEGGAGPTAASGAVEEDCRKLEDRIVKFEEKMSFVEEIKILYQSSGSPSGRRMSLWVPTTPTVSTEEAHAASPLKRES